MTGGSILDQEEHKHYTVGHLSLLLRDISLRHQQYEQNWISQTFSSIVENWLVLKSR